MAERAEYVVRECADVFSNNFCWRVYIYFYQPVAKEQLAESNLKSILRVRPIR